MSDDDAVFDMSVTPPWSKRRRPNPTYLDRLRAAEQRERKRTEAVTTRACRQAGESAADQYAADWAARQAAWRSARGMPPPEPEEVARVREQYLDALAAGPRRRR